MGPSTCSHNIDSNKSLRADGEQRNAGLRCRRLRINLTQMCITTPIVIIHTPLKHPMSTATHSPRDDKVGLVYITLVLRYLVQISNTSQMDMEIG